eukprot:1757735-Rhodomonas_salina.1
MARVREHAAQERAENNRQEQLLTVREIRRVLASELQVVQIGAFTGHQFPNTGHLHVFVLTQHNDSIPEYEIMMNMRYVPNGDGPRYSLQPQNARELARHLREVEVPCPPPLTLFRALLLAAVDGHRRRDADLVVGLRPRPHARAAVAVVRGERRPAPEQPQRALPRHAQGAPAARHAVPHARGRHGEPHSPVARHGNDGGRQLPAAAGPVLAPAPPGDPPADDPAGARLKARNAK